nr:NADH dehydrogenase subunit 2 [Hyphessobrycon pulchripinnis]UEV65411.1 NADH dehydrogenase subunit 2 [Hyphessobrycon pulchripinnis]
MSPIVKFSFIFTITLGTTITFMSSNWLLAWIGLELNTLAIIPLMTLNHHPRSTEAAAKYFLIQSAGAALLLFASALNAFMVGTWDIAHAKDYSATILITAALALKMGLAPLHLWLPEIMQGLDLLTGLILTTWQKLAPLALLLQISHTLHPTLLMWAALLSVMLGGWGGLNQTELRKILAYSSTAHLGWVIIIIQYAPHLALMTLGIYILSTMAAFLTLDELSSTKTNLFTQSWTKKPVITVTMLFILLSLAGLPPLSGFMPKWLILEELSKQNMTVIATFLVISSLISYFFYMRLCYFSTMTVFPTTPAIKIYWPRQTSGTPIYTAIASAATLVLLPILPFTKALTTLFFM